MKVLVPDLPTADELLPYLRRIDANRQYSNNGPLVQELERATNGVCVGNATVGIEMATRLLYKRKAIRIPAFTFVATATAVLRAGHLPVLADVDPETWGLLDPDNGLPVSPFGAALNSQALLTDAASAWGNGQTGNRVYSLHATKVFGAGEGGLVCGDPDLLDRIRCLANFGLKDGLITHPNGTNAKMGEYHAAVALAQLKRLPASTARRQALEARYRRNLAGAVEMQRRPAGNYAIFPVLVPERDRVSRELAEQGIETRSWYCPTLESHPCMANLATDGPLTTAKMLSERILCLPFHAHLAEGDIDQVSERLRAALRDRRPVWVA